MASAPNTSVPEQRTSYTRCEEASNGTPVSAGGANGRHVDVSFQDQPINALAINPHPRRTVYAGTDDGLFVSMGGGEHWRATRAATLLARGINDLATIRPEPSSTSAATPARGSRRTRRPESGRRVASAAKLVRIRVGPRLPPLPAL
jgi:hypothetical protein